jgi:hypothetical protein
MAAFDANKFIDFIKYFDEHNPNHVKAMKEVANILGPTLLNDDAQWAKTYRSKVQPASVSSVLAVPYYSQRDNYRDASRTCFSSSCAMLCKFLRPDSIKGDDDYIREVFKRGDTTDAAVQVQTLKHFGISSKFVTNGTFAMVDSQLAKGIPVPVGILHHGPGSAPSGGGHWLIIIGKEPDIHAPGGCWYIVNDPWGELDNATGTYPSTKGAKLKYSKKMLTQRWTVEGDASGWAIVAQKG